MIDGTAECAGQYADHTVRVSGILNDGPTLLFEMPAPHPAAVLYVRRRRAVVRRQRELSSARRLLAREAAAARQVRLPWVTLPKTVGDCRGPGICPAIRCRYNLALWVKPNGAIKVGRSHEKGRTLTYKRGRRASDAALEHAADLVVDLADRLDSLCVLDYAEQVQWIDEEESYTRIAAVLGCSKQRARTLVLEAMEDFDIARAREKRRQMRDRQAAALSPLVNIRKRPGPVMRPTVAQMGMVGT